VAAAAFRTEIAFDDTETRLEEASATATLAYHLSPRWGLQASLGGIVGGEVRRAGEVHDVGPGIGASVAGSWLALYETERRPFLLLTVSLGGSTTTTRAAGESTRLTAFDLRLNALVGMTFFDVLTPFITARAFGGPVSWKIAGESVVGGDEHHYAVGAGATVRVARFDVFVEALPLGERSASLGVGATF